MDSISVGSTICDDNVRAGSTLTYATTDLPNGIHRRIPVYSAASLYAKSIQLIPGKLSDLPACSAGNEGLEASVNDDTTALAWNATVVGGGANHVHAYCDGTNWKMQ